MKYPDSLNHLIEMIRQLPGVGEKTAERYAFACATAVSVSMLYMKWKKKKQ